MIRFSIIPLSVIAPCIIADTSHSRGVLSKKKEFPPREGVWHGDSPHLLLGGQAILFCGSHGTFSGHVVPPESKGGVTTAKYGAIFEGKLKLNPPLVRQARSYSLNEPIRIVERIVSNGNRGRNQTYATELTALVFNASGLPRNISIRESPRRRSIGKASITSDSRGTYRKRQLAPR